MGLLVDGLWQDKWYDTKSSGGKFVRSEAQFRNWLTADGAAGPAGKSSFKAEVGRYHLYVSHACPWAHRTIIFRALKGLQDLVSISVVDFLMGSEGWEFSERAGAIPDGINGKSRMHQIYTLADPEYSGRVTVPVLWDKHQQTIVSNESAEIIRMFNEAFNHITGNKADYYPQVLRSKIDEINDRIYHDINNGVYKSGFATTEEAYQEAVAKLFNTLDWVEDHLAQIPYLAGEYLTEADWRLFTTLIRFDPVYVGHFKCNLRRIADYPNLSNYMRQLYQMDGIKQTVNMDHIKRHYYESHTTINPTHITPLGPVLNYDETHNRGPIKLPE